MPVSYAQHLYAGNQGLAVEGSFFTLANPTPGTGLATIAALATLVDTAPFLVVKSPATKSIVFDYLRVTCTVPGTGGAALRFAVRTDATKADPTGGTAITPANCNQLMPASALTLTAFAGPLVAAAASGAVKTPTAALLKSAIPAAGDVFNIKFGGADQGVSSSANNVYVGAPPLVIGPGQLAAFHLWLPSQSTAGAYEFELGGSERAL